MEEGEKRKHGVKIEVKAERRGIINEPKKESFGVEKIELVCLSFREIPRRAKITNNA